MYCLYKQIQHFRSTGVSKLSPGYSLVVSIPTSTTKQVLTFVKTALTSTIL